MSIALTIRTKIRVTMLQNLYFDLLRLSKKANHYTSFKTSKAGLAREPHGFMEITLPNIMLSSQRI